MTVVVWIASVMLVAATFLALTRIVRGPSALDRMVAMDVLLSCLIGAIGLEAAYNRHGTTLAVLAVLALLGFVGSVAVARFAAGEADAPPGEGTGGGVGGLPSEQLAGVTSADPADLAADAIAPLSSTLDEAELTGDAGLEAREARPDDARPDADRPDETSPDADRPDDGEAPR